MAARRVIEEERRDTGIGLRISAAEKDMVNYICNKNGLDISDMVRDLIRQEYYRIKQEETI